MHSFAFIVLCNIKGELLYAVDDGSVADEEMCKRVGVVRGNEEAIQRNNAIKRKRKGWLRKEQHYSPSLFTNHREYKEEDDGLQR